MFWLKACPKCNGDLFLEMSSLGKDVVCLQCGYRRHITYSERSSGVERLQAYPVCATKSGAV